jgi:hypothetical protein
VNNCTSTSSMKKSAERKRIMIGAAAVVASGTFLGVGTQSAFAATPDPNPSGTATASTSAGEAQQSPGTIQAEITAILHGHVDGAQAQTLATGLADNSTAFSLLPSNLQKDVTTLKEAPPASRATDATKIATKAVNGRYGSLIENLAKKARSTSQSSAHSLVSEVTHDVKLGGTSDDQIARIARSVTERKDLVSLLPSALRTDLRALATASSADRSADVQKIEMTAIGGGYGSEIQKIADSFAASSLVTGH